MTERSGAPMERVQVRILKVWPGTQETVMFLSALKGGWEHWYKKHSYPCQGPEKCPRAAHAIPPLYWSYAPGLVFCASRRAWLPMVIQVSALLDHQLAGRTLRGEQWVLSRSEDKDGRDSVQGRYLDRIESDDLPEAFPIEEIIRYVKGVPNVYLGLPNTTPKKAIMEVQMFAVPVHIQMADEPEVVSASERKTMAQLERDRKKKEQELDAQMKMKKEGKYAGP